MIHARISEIEDVFVGHGYIRIASPAKCSECKVTLAEERRMLDLCDVCDAMLDAVMSQAGLVGAHSRWMAKEVLGLKKKEEDDGEGDL